MAREDVDSILASQAEFPLVRGVREKPATSPTADTYQPHLPGSMSDPSWRLGFSLLAKYSLHFELQTRYWHLPEAAALARDFPEILMILNHSGMPDDRSEAGLTSWRSGMQELAQHPNVSLKISGIGEAGHTWSINRQKRVVRESIEIFGVDRCMFASNFPVDRLIGTFDTIYNGFSEITRNFSDLDRAKLFHDNALTTYQIR